MIAQVRKRLGESKLERYCFSGIEQLDAMRHIRLPGVWFVRLAVSNGKSNGKGKSKATARATADPYGMTNKRTGNGLDGLGDVYLAKAEAVEESCDGGAGVFACGVEDAVGEGGLLKLLLG